MCVLNAKSFQNSPALQRWYVRRAKEQQEEKKMGYTMKNGGNLLCRRTGYVTSIYEIFFRIYDDLSFKYLLSHENKWTVLFQIIEFSLRLFKNEQKNTIDTDTY